MKLVATLFGLKLKSDNLFDESNGKTMDEYRNELLSKMAKRQFEKLDNLGLSIPLQVG